MKQMPTLSLHKPGARALSLSRLHENMIRREHDGYPTIETHMLTSSCFASCLKQMQGTALDGKPPKIERQVLVQSEPKIAMIHVSVFDVLLYQKMMKDAPWIAYECI